MWQKNNYIVCSLIKSTVSIEHIFCCHSICIYDIWNVRFVSHDLLTRSYLTCALICVQYRTSTLHITKIFYIMIYTCMSQMHKHMSNCTKSNRSKRTDIIIHHRCILLHLILVMQHGLEWRKSPGSEKKNRFTNDHTFLYMYFALRKKIIFVFDIPFEALE
jgi:hypothetical protein